MFNYDLDSWKTKAKAKKEEVQEVLKEGDLDDISENWETFDIELDDPVIQQKEEKPKKQKPKVRKTKVVSKVNIEIKEQLDPLEFQVLKEVFTAYKSQYQKHLNQMERFKLLLKKLGIEFSELKPQRRR